MKRRNVRFQIASYELVVEARDQGQPPLTGTATVLVTVLDKNDNPPHFTRLFSVNVTENAEIGTFVIRLTSTDPDIGQNANVTYSFTNNPGMKFSIDALSGNVTVNGHLDREEQDEYLLKVGTKAKQIILTLIPFRSPFQSRFVRVVVNRSPSYCVQQSGKLNR